MIGNKSGNGIAANNISMGGLRFPPPVTVEPKRRTAKKKASAEVVVSAPAAQPEAVVTPEIAVTQEIATTQETAVTQLVDAAVEPVGVMFES